MDAYGYTEIDRHLETFEGLAVVNYHEPGQPLGDPATTCPRLFTIYFEPRTPEPLSRARKLAMVAVVGLTALGVALWSGWAVIFGLFAILLLASAPQPPREEADREVVWDSFAGQPGLEEVQALVMGAWFFELDEGPQETIERLVAMAPKLPRLRAIFFGDVTPEECEISWIQQGDLAPLLDAYPNLETLVVRGGNGLRFTNLAHAKLRKLVVQSGGLENDTIADIAAARLPALEHLEIWFGDPNYGFEATIDEIRPLWQPERFASLQTLALRNCHLADQIAEALAREQNAVSRLTRLDLSLGTLTDLGAEALYNNPAIAHLDTLDLHHHYLSEDWMAKLGMLPVDVDVTAALGAVDPEDDECRYVAVSE